ncbi:MAG: ABC transporter permease [Myxococcaceae bacterium]
MNAGFGVGTWARFKRRRLAMLSLGMIALLLLVAGTADLIASDKPVAARMDGRLWILPAWTQPPDLRNETIPTLRQRVAAQADGWLVEPLIPWGPHQTDVAGALAAPSGEHLMGTDEIGRDVLARLVHGTRVSLGIGLVAISLCVLVGVALGLLAGFYGGRLDGFISRCTEVMLSFPTLFLVLCVLGLMRVKTLLPVMVVIGLTGWTDVARLVRAEALRLREMDFVTASRALGASDVRVLLRHVLPNALGPVLASAAVGIAQIILLESALSFLGFGVPPPTASWGELLTQAQRYVTYPSAWWLTLYPGGALFLTVIAFNLMAEGLRDAMDPR